MLRCPRSSESGRLRGARLLPPYIKQSKLVDDSCVVEAMCIRGVFQDITHNFNTWKGVQDIFSYAPFSPFSKRNRISPSVRHSPWMTY